MHDTTRDGGSLGREPQDRAPETTELPGLLHRHIVRARVLSARMVELQRSSRVAFHAASIGHEGAIVGAAVALRNGDWLFPGVREWYAALARGLPTAAYVHHAFGSAEDPARGHAAPDHAPARAYQVVPPSGVASAHLPQGVGAAWASKIAKASELAVLVMFGSEVVESGDFHNAMNFAGVFRAPVVFACRAPFGKDAPRRRVAERAVAYGLAHGEVDGSDALAVHAIVEQALARARAGQGATLLELAWPLPEAGLARLGDGPALDDAALFDLGEGDPLVRIRSAVGSAEAASVEQGLARDLRAEVDGVVAAAEWVGPPAKATIFEHVYAALPPHLEDQKRHLEGGRRG